MTSALKIIRAEHRDIARLLHALEDLAEDDAVLARGVKSGLIASMLHRLRVFPYAIHHPKEERHLFPTVMAKDANVVALVATLVKEHAMGYALLREVEVALAAAGGEKDRARLKEAIFAYVGHKFRHMEREEKEILPIAEEMFDAETLASLQRAFAANNKSVLEEKARMGLAAHNHNNHGESS